MKPDDPLFAYIRRLVAPGTPFELLDNEDGSKSFRSGPHTLIDLFQRAQKFGDRPLLIEADRTLTYRELFDQAAKLSESISRLPGNGRIALGNMPPAEWLTTFVAATLSGFSCVLLPPGLTDKEIGAWLERAECETCIDSSWVSGNGWAVGNEFRPDEIAAVGWRGESTPVSEALVSFTSGSTGTPKGVVHTHKSLMASIKNMMLAGAIGNFGEPKSSTVAGRPLPPVTVVLAPLQYVAGYSAFLLALFTGGAIVLMSATAEAQQVREVVARERVQSIVGASSELLVKMIGEDSGPDQLHSLRKIHLFGGEGRKRLQDVISARLPSASLSSGYGLTESGGTLAVGIQQDAVADLARPSAIILPSVEIKIVGDNGVELPAGSIGNVVVRGDMLFDRYLDRNETARAFADDGWFRTGDSGLVDEAGFLMISDRNEVKSSPLSQALIEERIAGIAGIGSFALLRDEVEKTWIAFVCDENGDLARSEAVRHKISDSGNGEPVAPTFVDKLPRTASGKVDQRRLLSLIKD